MGSPFEGPYDSFLALSLCEYHNGHKGDRELLNELLLQTAPLVGIVTKVEIGRSTLDEDIEVLQGEALEACYWLFESGEVPTVTSKAFTNFLYTKIRWSLIDSIRRSREQIFDYWKISEEPGSKYGKTYEELESEIYIEQVKKIVRSILDHDIRHTGKDKEACKYIALCLLGFLNHDPMSAQFRFKLSRARTSQLIQYTQILVKTTSYAVRDMDADT